MTPERFAEVRDILLEVIDGTSGDRGARVDALCGNRADLRRDVRALLAYDRGRVTEVEETAIPRFRLRPAEGEAGSPDLEPGTVVAGRYRIGAHLGRGGVGDVWRALDLKLQVDLALKAIRPDHLGHPRSAELLRREIRAARRVGSPHVCRIFDLVDAPPHELLSMEFVDGETLRDRLRERSPLPTAEARDILGQLLVGLDAIHDVGLLHLDLKPENVMITRVGRVVIMDLGLACPPLEPGSRSGTPPYMAPEHLLGQPLDARTDLFAVGIVLAEMVATDGVRDGARQRSVRAVVRRAPESVAEAPWDRLLARAAAPDPHDRFPSASAFIQALDLAVGEGPDATPSRPYPGLDAFTEEEAATFFGREREVEAIVWRLRRSHHVTVVGPSGCGKTSLLRAGVIPALGSGWRAVYLRPGAEPARVLAAAVASVDRDASERVLVVDQLEELFTVASPEQRAAFLSSLSRLVLEENVRVLVGIRDDFLMACHAHPELRPLFAQLVPIGALDDASLRRSVVEPARRSGVRFEDPALVEEILEEVRAERGALPLLGFGLACLWEHRDRDRKQITRDGYHTMGRMTGALARHAEHTLDEIGPARAGMVRELLRQLVSARRTRVGRRVRDLIELFEDRRAAEAVIETLVRARLLTSYRTTVRSRGGEAEERHVEIIHESLLVTWPRLRRWHAEDAEGARLRDQLREAARIWDERGRPASLLWTGPAYEEYRLWTRRFGKLVSGTDADFAWAMEANAERTRRRRRRAVTAAFAALALVVTVVGGLWVRSDAEARRARATRLLVEAQLRLPESPTAALAIAAASLELHDAPAARRLVVEAIDRGPIYRVSPTTWRHPSETYADRVASWSPDGAWLACGGTSMRLYPLAGGEPVIVPPPTMEAGEQAFCDEIRWTPDGSILLFTMFTGNRMVTRVWSMEKRRSLRELWDWDPLGLDPARGRFLAASTRTNAAWWPFGDGEPEPVPIDLTGGAGFFGTADASMIGFVRDSAAYVLPMDGPDAAPVRLGVHASTPIASTVSIDPLERWMAVADEGEAITLWPLDPDRDERPLRLKLDAYPRTIHFSPDGTLLATANREGTVSIWALDGPATSPTRLLGFRENVWDLDFDPIGRWIAKTGGGLVSVWPTGNDRDGRVLRGHTNQVWSLLSMPDGSALMSSSGDGTVRRWSLDHRGPEGGEVLGHYLWPDHLALDAGRRVAVNCPLTVLDLGSRAATELDGGCSLRKIAIRPDGALLAIGNPWAVGKASRITVVRPGTGEERHLEWTGPETYVCGLRFLPDGALLSADGFALRRWDVDRGTHEVLATGAFQAMDASRDGQVVVVIEQPEIDDIDAAGSVRVFDVGRGASHPVPSHGEEVVTIAVSPDGDHVASGTGDGVVQIGSASGEAPHLRFGHEGPVLALCFTPDGAHVASGGDDRTIRIWGVTDHPPLHLRSRDAILAHVRELTNLALVNGEAEIDPGPVAVDPPSGTSWVVEDPILTRAAIEARVGR